ncbi:hypothetical protein LINPERHAP2_LOCUS26007 [Linum perenne]
MCECRLVIISCLPHVYGLIQSFRTIKGRSLVTEKRKKGSIGKEKTPKKENPNFCPLLTSIQKIQKIKKTKRERVQKFKYSHYCSRNYKTRKERKHQARNSKLTRSHPTTTFYKIIGYHLRNHYL